MRSTEGEAEPANRSVSVAQIVGPAMGGIATHVDALVPGLDSLGVAVTVCAPESGSVRADVPIALPVGRRAWRILRAAATVRTLPAQVLHAHGLQAAAVSLLGARHRPVVVTVHNLVLSGWLARCAERVVYRRCTRLIAPSADTAVAIRERTGRIAKVVLPVFDRPRSGRDRDDVRGELGVNDEEVLVVVPARLHPQKDHETLLRALTDRCRGADRTPSELKVVLAGDGPDRDRIQAEVDRRGLRHRVSLLGRRGDLADLLAAADIVVVPSRWESVPLVVLEAMLLGAPVVASAVGIVPELGAAVRCVPLGDASAMRAEMEALLADPVERARLGERGRARALREVDPSSLIRAVRDEYMAVTGTDRS